MAPGEDSEQVEAIALLNEPARRALYGYVVARGREVGRDEAANAVGVTRALAAFHLDKLAEAGLLDVAYRRLTERRGPGAGRPAKVYRRSGATIELSIPARRYDALARLLASALERVGTRGAHALQEAARDVGKEIGAATHRAGRARPAVEGIEAALAENGFEPARVDDGTVVLGNCPFDAVAREFTDLVCGANVAFMRGVLDGSGAAGLEVSLEPKEGRCCAVFRPVASEKGPAAGSR